jgi:hypothetical protein
VLDQLTIAVAGRAVPAHEGFQVITGIACGAALFALAIAALLPAGEKTPQAVVAQPA